MDYKVWSLNPKERAKQEATDSPYVITYHEDQKYWSCTCKHWQIRLSRTQTRCKHIDFVIAHSKLQEHLQRQAEVQFELEGLGWDEPPPKPDAEEDDEHL